MRGYSVTTFKLEGQTNSIRFTKHALKRLKQRNISKSAVLNAVFSFTKEEYLYYKKRQVKVVLIDFKNNLCIPVVFQNNTLKIATAFDYLSKYKSLRMNDDFYKMIS